METISSNLHPDAVTSSGDARRDRASRQAHATPHSDRRSGRSGDDVVRWREFRLALWLGGVALAAILGVQGFMYSAIMDLKGEIAGVRVDVHTQVGGLRADVQTQIDGLRADVQTQIDGLRADMQTQIDGLRADMQTQIDELRADMQTQFTELRERIHELSERVARIETRLDMVAAPVSASDS